MDRSDGSSVIPFMNMICVSSNWKAVELTVLGIWNPLLWNIRVSQTS